MKVRCAQSKYLYWYIYIEYIYCTDNVVYIDLMFFWPPLRMLKDTLAVCSFHDSSDIVVPEEEVKTWGPPPFNFAQSQGSWQSQGVTTWFGLWVNLRVTKIPCSWLMTSKSPKKHRETKKTIEFLRISILHFFEKKAPQQEDIKMEIGIYILPACSRTVENTVGCDDCHLRI